MIATAINVEIINGGIAALKVIAAFIVNSKKN
jgi:hypothetical protein